MNETREVLSREEVANSINPHLLSLLKIDRQHEAVWMDPRCLLSAARFDVLAKYLYVRFREFGCTARWPEDVYREHLRIWSGFEEADGSGKSNFDDYKRRFEALIESFKKNDFQSKNGLVPVGKGDVIIDGAHRLGTALALNKRIRVVRFDVEANRYDYKYFRKRGLQSSMSDALALEYCRLKQGARIAVVFPISVGQEGEIEKLIEKTGPIFYKKNIPFTAFGRVNLIRLLYRGEPWLGDGKRDSIGLRHHVENRFVSSRSVQFIFFDCLNLSKLLKTKDEIRSLFGLGNDSIHINDHHEQTVELSEKILNDNGVHFLNHARFLTTPVFDELSDNLKRWMKCQEIERERVCIDGSGVMAVYGLRDVNDLDFLYCGEEIPETGYNSVSCHNHEAVYYEQPIDELVIDPGNHFWHRDVKVIALPICRRMKEVRNEAKDRRDLVRIDSLGDGGTVVALALKLSAHVPETIYSMRHRIISFMKRCVPPKMRPMAKAIYDFPMIIRDWLGPAEKMLIYRGFELVYSRGTSLVRTISRGEVYEKSLSAFIVEELKQIDGPLFVDVGANIGLVTLNVLHELRDVQVWAFEPGPHQAALFRKTLSRNGLAAKVWLNEVALSNKHGTTDFHAHRTRHASGDGLKDTGRSGRTSTITVATKTLSDYWQEQGCPNVDLVKIDTEGAELWVLEGAVKMLQQCKPVVVFEMDERNLRPYPYEALDILEFFEKNSYEVRVLGGRLVTHHALAEALATGCDFVARPTTVSIQT